MKNRSRILALGFSLLVGFSGVLLAYYVYLDGKAIENLQMQGAELRQTMRAERPFTQAANSGDSEDFRLITMINRYRERGFLNPEMDVQGKIRRLMESGKTSEEAISELYSEESTLIF